MSYQITLFSETFAAYKATESSESNKEALRNIVDTQWDRQEVMERHHDHRDRTVKALLSFWQTTLDLKNNKGRSIEPYRSPLEQAFNALFGHDFFVPNNYERYPVRRFFIVGETGTGKEAIATICRNTLAALCDDTDAPNKAVSAATLNSGTLESELFGHEKGAFTGASARKSGLLKQVNGGVLFLDEIDKTERYLQTKLLRVLESGDFKPVGGEVTHNTSFHLVAASSTSLAALQRQKDALPDFLHRLTDTVIQTVGLRELLSQAGDDAEPDAYRKLSEFAERKESCDRDDPLLAEESEALANPAAFVETIRLGRQRQYISTIIDCQLRGNGHPGSVSVSSRKRDKRLVECMAGYGWPGNLRQLDRLVFKIALLGTERIEEICQKERQQWPDTPSPDDPQPTTQPLKYLPNPNPRSLKEELEACERYHYEMAFRNNRSFVDVARTLSVSRQTASRRLKELGIVKDN